MLLNKGKSVYILMYWYVLIPLSSLPPVRGVVMLGGRGGRSTSTTIRSTEMLNRARKYDYIILLYNRVF